MIILMLNLLFFVLVSVCIGFTSALIFIIDFGAS